MHTAAFLALALPLAAPQLKDKPARDPLLGRWEATSMVVDLNADAEWQGLEYEFGPAGRWAIYKDGREDSTGHKSYTADPTAKPAVIDLTEHGRTYSGVYAVGPAGDTLTISLTIPPNAGRPAGLAPAGGTMTVTLKRVSTGK